MEVIKKKEGFFRYQRDQNNYVDFCPERGGLITNWVSDKKEILYFDKNRFNNIKKSIRGGIPILFPICGNLENNNSLFGKKFINLTQHGFARDLKWDFLFDKLENVLCLSLSDCKETWKYFPYSFTLNINLKLESDSLKFNIIIRNRSQSIMPVNFGLHPYFKISDFKNIDFLDYPINCQNQKNNCIEDFGQTIACIAEGVDLLTYSKGYNSFIDFGLRRQIILNNPSPFDINVVWTDPPRKMLCMEPWTSPRNSLIDGYRRIDIPPNNSQELFTSIKIQEI